MALCLGNVLGPIEGMCQIKIQGHVFETQEYMMTVQLRPKGITKTILLVGFTENKQQRLHTAEVSMPTHTHIIKRVGLQRTLYSIAIEHKR